MKNIKGFEDFKGENPINEGWLTNLFKGFFKPSDTATKNPLLMSKSAYPKKGWSLDPTFGFLQEYRKRLNAKAKASASFNKTDYWTLIALIACENYTTEKQGMSDTAQSVYNRYNVPGKPYGKTIKDIILSKGQYAVVAEGKKKGAKWDNIDTMQKAIDAYAKTKSVTLKDASSAIAKAIEAQKDSTLGANAGKYVQSRTEFLSGPPTAVSAKGTVERPAKGKNNAFFWNYAGKKYFYSKNDLAPKAKPDSVKVA